MIAIRAYSCRSTSLLLVKGGSNSSIGAGVLRPLSPSWVHNVRRIKNIVARSERGSAEISRVLGRFAGVAGLAMGSFRAAAD